MDYKLIPKKFSEDLTDFLDLSDKANIKEMGKKMDEYIKSHKLHKGKFMTWTKKVSSDGPRNETVFKCYGPDITLDENLMYLFEPFLDGFSEMIKEDDPVVVPFNVFKALCLKHTL